MTLNKLIQVLKGGTGSGNFGHSGRPGKIGGSQPISVVMDSLKQRLNINTNVIVKVVDSIEAGDGIEAEYKPNDGTIYLTKSALTQGSGELGVHAKTVAGVLGSKALIAHELAHVKDNGWDRSITSSKKLAHLFLDQKTQVLDGNYSKMLSKLSLSNPTEFFAEGIAIYAINSKLLKARNPELYAFIEENL